MSVLGCDLSHWQGVIDFTRMYNAGARFVFIKASEHVSWRDSRFKLNWLNARAAGLLVGAYHYYRPGYNADQQARNFFEAVAETGFFGNLPQVVDYEEPDTAINLKVFVDKVKYLFNKTPIIYTSQSKWFIPPPAWTQYYDLWCASYTTAPVPTLPAGWNLWKFWQYSKKGDGHAFGTESYDLDMNWFNGDYQDLLNYAVHPPEPPSSLPDAVRILPTSLNIRSVPDAYSTTNIVAVTSKGKVIKVEDITTDALGRAWYRLGRGMFVAAWLCEPIM